MNIKVLYILIAYVYLHFIFPENNIFAQTINPPPTITIYLSSESAPIYEDFEISWICNDPSSSLPEYQLQNRYKLDVPEDWIGGIKYNINKWSEYKDGINDHLIYSNFIIEGTYKISVQSRNKISGVESGVFSKTFEIFWEDPIIQEEAFNIDFARVDSASTQQEKYQILAEEYKNAYLMWNQKLEYELNLKNATISKDELIELFAVSITQEFTQEALISMFEKSTQNIVKKVLLPLNLYEMIKLGAVDIILIYRRSNIDKAFNMAVVSYKAWKLFESLSDNHKTLVFILDSSGSMKESDPLDNRKNALIEIVKTMNNVENILVLDFDDEANWINADNYKNRDNFKLVQQISKVDSDGGTNIGKALKVADEALENIRINQNATVILISDGMGDYFGEAELFRNKQIPVFTISLLDRINENLMNSIAMTTGGNYYKAYTEYDIIDAYFSILQELFPFDIILSGNFYQLDDNQSVKQTFYIEPGVPSFTIRLFSGEKFRYVNIIKPDGQIYYTTTTDWVSGEYFKSLEIVDPAQGKWEVNYSIDINQNHNAISKILITAICNELAPEYMVSLNPNSQILISHSANYDNTNYKITDEKIQIYTPAGKTIFLSKDMFDNYIVPTDFAGSYKIDINSSGFYNQDYPFQRFHTYTFLVEGIEPYSSPILLESYGNIVIADCKLAHADVGDKCYIYSRSADKEIIIGNGHVVNKIGNRCTIELIELKGNIQLDTPCSIVFFSNY